MIRASFLSRFLIALCCFGFLCDLNSQNIVPNPSFEEYYECPSWVTQIYLAIPWISPTNNTPDYLNVCATHPWVDVPLNAFGYQEAHTGVAYAGAQYHGEPFGNREYISIILDEPLLSETTYEVNFWVSLADMFCGIKELGVHFSHEMPGPPQLFGVLDVEPQIKSNLGFISDTANWVLISGCFIPQGGEIWMTIGNFTPEHLTEVDTNCSIPPDSIFYNDSYYYMDDVSVIASGPPGSYDLELGDPVFSCDPYLINPAIPNAHYYWENGSTDSTLMVYETGTYSLTVTVGCLIGEDSIEVIIHDDESVEIGPDEIDICNGEPYIISLDPNWFSYEWQDGSTSSEYVITTAGLYQVTMNDGCNETTDEIQVYVINPPPPFSFGEDTYICPDEQIEFDFDFTIGDFLWQDSSTNSNISITEPGSYSLTITNMCGSYSDDILVTQLLLPEFILGPDSLHLCSDDTFSIDLNPELGDYYWQDGSDNHFYDITGPGLYSLTVTNECGSVNHTILVDYSAVPLIELGDDIIRCENISVLLNPNATGNYVWQDQSMDSIFLVTQPGVYSVTVSNQCGLDADSVVVNYADSLPQINLGADINLCPGDIVVLSAIVQGANYTWQDQSTADSLLVSSAGTYWLQITNECNTVSDTIEVSIDDNPPDVVLPSTITICSGSTFILDAGITGVQYLWNDSTQNSSISINAPGVYSVTVSNACGIDADTVVVVDGGPAPSVSLPEELSICPGESVLISPASSDVLSWLWQDGSTDSSYEVTSQGLVSVEVSNDCGVAFDTSIVTLLPPSPILDLGNDTSLCLGELLTLSITIPDVDIEWSDGTTGSSFDVHDEGLVYAIISNQCGSSIDSLIISLLPPPPVVDLGADQSLCPGETITLSPGITGVDYLWHDGSTAAIYETALPGTIILTVTNECGFSTDTLLIIEDTNGPDVELGEDILACEGDIVTLNAGISGVDFLWQDGSTLSQLTTNISGTFILHVSNACGEDVDTISVEINGVVPTPNLGTDTMLCEGNILQLLSDADAITSIEWQDGSTLPAFIVSSPGMYILSESNHCGDAADTINIDFSAAPQTFELGNDTILCPGTFIMLNAPLTNDLITWQDGSHGFSMIADQEQTYSLQISNDCGNVFDDLEVSFDDRVPVIDIDPVIEICDGDILTLDATQFFEAGYLWNTGSTNSSLQVNTPGLYAVNVTTPCESKSVEVEIINSRLCKDDIYIPNVFSPNGDQFNDLWSITAGPVLDVIEMQCTIYDRWGNMVFDTRSVPVVWDGRLRGESVLPGVYAYVLLVEYWEENERRSRVLVGDVTVIR